MGHGLFTCRRGLERVFTPELGYFPEPVVIVPSHGAAITRRGFHSGKQGFKRSDLTHEALKAVGAE